MFFLKNLRKHKAEISRQNLFKNRNCHKNYELIGFSLALQERIGKPLGTPQSAITRTRIKRAMNRRAPFKSLNDERAQKEGSFRLLVASATNSTDLPTLLAGSLDGRKISSLADISDGIYFSQSCIPCSPASKNQYPF